MSRPEGCLQAGCLKRPRFGRRCSVHGGGAGPRCAYEGCDAKPRSGAIPFCSGHARAKLCRMKGCYRLVGTRTSYCPDHEEQIRCQVVPGCKNRDCGGGCVKHGGGRRCEHNGCSKGAASGPLPLCKVHGGGPRCAMEGCGKSAEGQLIDGVRFCVRHGGGRRCKHRDPNTGEPCSKGAQRSSHFCVKHDLSLICTIPGCGRRSQFKGGGHCPGHTADPEADLGPNPAAAPPRPRKRKRAAAQRRTAAAPPQPFTAAEAAAAVVELGREVAAGAANMAGSEEEEGSGAGEAAAAPVRKHQRKRRSSGVGHAAAEDSPAQSHVAEEPPSQSPVPLMFRVVDGNGHPSAARATPLEQHEWRQRRTSALQGTAACPPAPPPHRPPGSTGVPSPESDIEEGEGLLDGAFLADTEARQPARAWAGPPGGLPPPPLDSRSTGAAPPPPGPGAECAPPAWHPQGGLQGQGPPFETDARVAVAGGSSDVRLIPIPDLSFFKVCDGPPAQPQPSPSPAAPAESPQGRPGRLSSESQSSNKGQRDAAADWGQGVAPPPWWTRPTGVAAPPHEGPCGASPAAAAQAAFGNGIYGVQEAGPPPPPRTSRIEPLPLHTPPEARGGAAPAAGGGLEPLGDRFRRDTRAEYAGIPDITYFRVANGPHPQDGALPPQGPLEAPHGRQPAAQPAPPHPSPPPPPPPECRHPLRASGDHAAGGPAAPAPSPPPHDPYHWGEEAPAAFRPPPPRGGQGSPPRGRQRDVSAADLLRFKVSDAPPPAPAPPPPAGEGPGLAVPEAQYAAPEPQPPAAARPWHPQLPAADPPHRQLPAEEAPAEDAYPRQPPTEEVRPRKKRKEDVWTRPLPPEDTQAQQPAPEEVRPRQLPGEEVQSQHPLPVWEGARGGGSAREDRQAALLAARAEAQELRRRLEQLEAQMERHVRALSPAQKSSEPSVRPHHPAPAGYGAAAAGAASARPGRPPSGREARARGGGEEEEEEGGEGFLPRGSSGAVVPAGARPAPRVAPADQGFKLYHVTSGGVSRWSQVRVASPAPTEELGSGGEAEVQGGRRFPDGSGGPVTEAVETILPVTAPAAGGFVVIDGSSHEGDGRWDQAGSSTGAFACNIIAGFLEGLPAHDAPRRHKIAPSLSTDN